MGDFWGSMGDGLGGVYCGMSGKCCFVKVWIKSDHKYRSYGNLSKIQYFDLDSQGHSKVKVKFDLPGTVPS